MSGRRDGAPRHVSTERRRRRRSWPCEMGGCQHEHSSDTTKVNICGPLARNGTFRQCPRRIVRSIGGSRGAAPVLRFYSAIVLRMPSRPLTAEQLVATVAAAPDRAKHMAALPLISRNMLEAFAKYLV